MSKPAATVRTLQAESRSPDAVEILAAIDALSAKVDRLQASLREQRRDELTCALRDAIEEELDCGFTCAMLIEIARTEPENPITHVLNSMFDMTQPERNVATQLGRLLGTLSWLAADGEKGGSALYYLIE